MLALFSGALSASCGFTTAQCGSTGGPFVYLDDAIFTGNRVRSDVTAWSQPYYWQRDYGV